MRELPVPRRSDADDLIAARCPCKILVQEHRALPLRSRVSAVKIEPQSVIARANGLCDLLPVGIEKGSDAKFLRFHHVFRKVKQAHCRFFPLTPAIKAQNAFPLCRSH